MALELVGRPDFPEQWVILPSPDGSTLSLMWGDACTTDQLMRVNSWNTMQHAALHAARISSGQASDAPSPPARLL